MRLASLYPLLLANRFLCRIYQNASLTLFACQWTSNSVPITVLPSSTYSTLTRAIPNTPGRACQDVRVVYAIERAGPGLDDNIMRYVNSPVAHDAVPAQHDPVLFLGGVPFALPAPSRIIRFFRLHNLTFKLALSGLGTRCMCNAVLGRNIITVGVKRLRCAEVLFQPSYQSNMKCVVYIRKELCLSSGTSMFQVIIERATKNRQRYLIHSEDQGSVTREAHGRQRLVSR